MGLSKLVAFVLVALVACLLAATPRGLCTDVGSSPSGVDFDLTPVLANVPGDVVIRACVEMKCVQHVGSSDRWATFRVYDEALTNRWAASRVNDAASTNPEMVDVRVVVNVHGQVVFDATRLVQVHKWMPNGPRCPPTRANAAVQATPEGDLIQQ